ncbi:MAG: gas vesicle protein [Chloroflexi bacterium]|nr:gas vesicle protein [Chloroflexota bacterium]
MEPTRNSHATLVDLLDRVLDKGLIIHADLIVSVAGVPLIGVNLRAALAGMETMLRYGLMRDWDEEIRTRESEYRREQKSSLVSGEEIITEMLGSYHCSEGIYAVWRTGRFLLTDKRLILYHTSFEEVLFETALDEIMGLALENELHFTGKPRENLNLLLKCGNIVRLHARDTLGLKEALEQGLISLGVCWEEIPNLNLHDDNTAKFLLDGEEVMYCGGIWHQIPSRGILAESWKPGHLYLTSRRLCWWYDFEEMIGFETPLNCITGSMTEIKELGTALKRGKALDVVYIGERGKEVASFSGDNLADWERALNEASSRRDCALTGEMETCPRCGREAESSGLLERGCNYCAWISPRTMKKELVTGIEVG